MHQTLEHTYGKKISTTGGASDRKAPLRLEEKKKEYLKHLRKNTFLYLFTENCPFRIQTTTTKSSFAASALVTVLSNTCLFLCVFSVLDARSEQRGWFFTCFKSCFNHG